MAFTSVRGLGFKNRHDSLAEETQDRQWPAPRILIQSWSERCSVLSDCHSGRLGLLYFSSQKAKTLLPQLFRFSAVTSNNGNSPRLP